MASCGVANSTQFNPDSLWYHQDISRATAEELLAKSGRDGSFLVRDSESVTGAYALCVLYQKHVHTYRILPDEEDFLAVQTSQGVQARRFKTLNELISIYLQPNQGLVSTLLYPVEHEKESPEDRDYSDGEDDKPPLPPRSASTSSYNSAVSNLVPAGQEGATESSPNGISTISHEYLKGSYALDLEAVKSGASNLPHLNSTLISACKKLHGEVDKVLSGLEILLKVFDQQSLPILTRILQKSASQGGELDLENLVSKLSVLKDFLSSIEKKALKALQDMSTTAQSLPVLPAFRKVKGIPVQAFEVKLDSNLDLTKIGKSQKYSLSVDVDGGKLVVMKKLKDSQEDWNTFTHDKIRQLIKSQRVQNKLGIVFEKEKDKVQRKDFIFENARKREAFCQLLQLMKNKHSNQDEPDMISIFVGTWNMGSIPPPKNIISWVTSKGLGKTLDEMTVTIPHDIYVFGTQENSMGDKEWIDFLRAALKDLTEIEFKMVAVQSLWSIKLAVLVKPEHENRISHISTSSVKTGIANTLGNKGAVGVSFMFNGTSFGFVNCHLTSGSEKTARRNQNYLDILRLLSLGDRQLSSFDISLKFTHLFWFGDLNYRLDMDVQEILNYINRKEFDPLLKVDQLNLEKEKNKIFLRFSEEEITYPPTYRYERGSRDTYVWHKQKTTGVRTNVPSWCDRVLSKSHPETHIICNSYGCTDDIVSSDHSPVFSTFEVGVTSQFVSKKGLSKSSDQACIEFENIEAIVKTASRTKFFIEFYSTCLEEFKKSSENDTQNSDNINFLKVAWSSKQLPTLKPILSDIEYLQDQHLLLTVKSMDGYESYGECVIALKSMIGSTAQQFLTYLSHRGEETGNIRGSMKVRVPVERMGTRERLYEWISIDKDEMGSTKMKSGTCSRLNQEYVKTPSRKPGLAESHAPQLTKSFEEAEKNTTSSRLSSALPGAGKEDANLTRPKQEPVSSFNNPAYYVLEGVPHQQALMSLGEPPSPSSPDKPATQKSRVAITVPPQPERRRQNSGGTRLSSEDDLSTLNRPPPDFPPPPLPRTTEFEMKDNPFYISTKESQQFASVKPPGGKEESGKCALSKIRTCVKFNEPLESRLPPKAQTRLQHSPGGYMIDPSHSTSFQGLMDDHSCSVLQMAKTLSEVDYQGGKNSFLPTAGRESHSRNPDLASRGKIEIPVRGFHSDYNHPSTFPSQPIKESIEEDLSEEAICHGGSSSSSLYESTVGEWLRSLGLEKYEGGLIHNGWDDLEFLSDITPEDLEEAGVYDQADKKVILESLQQMK
ncbi:phosphatidylinositol 3,4,5-trisphosphate 5-phosphatase 2 [Protopterus annectens]|uniref:phosphatidylinositol 3,4,5-trisphosphate 5-phosphatase 2 n=1 Tax=Protopterus annectens TaxID=7888 RepID=UPI001CFA4BEB|nr:phosphatidylinositol 3,4,5-trisphosphate 5-phosphatase 2 [Protopterus annectens]